MDGIFESNPPLGEREKVMTTSNSLEGEAYDWYLWWSRKCDACSFHWKNFTTTLLKRFHDEEDDDLYNKFVHLKQKDKIFVVVDRLTKYAHFMAVRKTDSTKQIADVFCKNIYKLHGFPKVIISDRDAKFKGNFWKESCKNTGISLNMSFAYHPQTDGQT
jgi:hypothetical protein